MDVSLEGQLVIGAFVDMCVDHSDGPTIASLLSKVKRWEQMETDQDKRDRLWKAVTRLEVLPTSVVRHLKMMWAVGERRIPSELADLIKDVEDKTFDEIEHHLRSVVKLGVLDLVHTSL